MLCHASINAFQCWKLHFFMQHGDFLASLQLAKVCERHKFLFFAFQRDHLEQTSWGSASLPLSIGGKLPW